MELVVEKYKQTEVGLIPSDWEVYVLGNLLNGIADVDHYMPKTERYGVPYVMTGDLKDYASDIDFDSCKKISYDDYEKLSKKVRNFKGDIILARYATVGTVSYVNIDFDFVVSYSCVTIKPDKSRLIDLFLYYYFKSNIFRLEVKNKVNANIQDNVGIGDLVKMKIPIPPTKAEQTAIATALSDADALISGLEKLITKKRNIKQGAMQKLLQPKEGWEVKKLGDVATIVRGASPRPIEDPKWFDENSTIGWVRISDVTKSVKILTETTQSLSELGILSSRYVEEGNLIMSICATVGRPILTRINVCIHDGFVVFRNPKIEINYLYYFLCFIENDWSKNGQTGSQMNLNTTLINTTEIPVPSNYEEQTRIANILSDMDVEITALETKLEKYRNVKLGMMQNLLTGKIRLV